jgi:glycosyltransferase involved in cell wall biosynthesis
LIEELNIEDKVEIVGPKYGKEKEEYFVKSDIFIFPTFYENETFGLVNLEAMQYRLPVITTNEGGIPDVVIDGETGFIIEPRDIGDLANKIEILINDQDLRQKMGKAGYKRYHEYFTLDHFEMNMTQTLLDIYNKRK